MVSNHKNWGPFTHNDRLALRRPALIQHVDVFRNSSPKLKQITEGQCENGVLRLSFDLRSLAYDFQDWDMQISRFI